nr:uncharacterized protein LOC126534458 [Dermacentor andersoni]
MVERHSFGILLLAAHLALLECKFPLVSRKAYNMSQFLNTKERIWTYETNGPTNLECEVEVIHTITPKQIFFMKAYYENGTKITSKLLGKFELHRLKRLDVYSLGGEMRFSEDIIYMSSTSSCAVIRVAKSGGKHPTFDLRVRNSSTKEVPEKKCLRHFLTHVKRAQVIYRPRCQHIFDTSGQSSLLVIGGNKN